jgi:hypothetical protein
VIFGVDEQAARKKMMMSSGAMIRDNLRKLSAPLAWRFGDEST